MNRVFTTVLAAALIASMLSSQQTSALGITTDGGVYSEYPLDPEFISQYGIYAFGENRFRVASRDSLITLFDQKRGLRYRIDFSKGEQDLNPKYVQFLKTDSKVQLLGRFVDRITVSDFRSAKVPKSDRIIGNLNIYISQKTNAGMLKAKLQVPFSIESAKMEIRSFDNVNFEEKVDRRRVVATKLLGKVNVIEFELGSDKNANTVGREVMQLVSNMVSGIGYFNYGTILIPADGAK